MGTASHTLAFFSYGFLYLTVIALWFSVPISVGNLSVKLHNRSAIQIWHGLLVVSIGLGLLSQQIKPVGMIPIILLPIAVY
jgi:hypothetical protein